MADKPTTSWDETDPAAADDIGDGDDAIRTTRTSLREVIASDHYFPSSGQDSNYGYHNVIKLKVQTSAPTTVATVGQIYGKSDGATVELYFKDAAGNEIQLTDAGGLLVASALLTTGDQSAAGTKTITEEISLDKGIITLTTYTTGTAQGTNGSAVILGNGTSWDDEVQAGCAIKLDSDAKYYVISSVDSDEQLTLTAAYEGTGGSWVTYVASETIDSRVPSWEPNADTVIAASILDGVITAAKMSSAFEYSVCKIGTFSGGSGQVTVTGVGFEPDFVVIGDTETSGVVFGVNGQSALFYTWQVENLDTDYKSAIQFNSDGFVLLKGNNPVYNVDGNTHWYFAIKAQ